VAEETIRSHAKSILEKLKQPNRAQAVLAAIRMGLIKLGES
jgi:DNA-binding NarL/FixJ family response regulator